MFVPSLVNPTAVRWGGSTSPAAARAQSSVPIGDRSKVASPLPRGIPRVGAKVLTPFALVSPIDLSGYQRGNADSELWEDENLRFWSMMAGLIALTTFAASPTEAGVPWGIYRTANADLKRTIDTYMLGVNYGLLMANSKNLSIDQRLIYCQPEELALESRDINKLIENYAENHTEVTDKTEIEFMLLSSLIEAYPCN